MNRASGSSTPVRRTALAAMLCACLGSACQSFISLDERAVALRLRGTVTLAVDGAPVPGASVTLGRRTLPGEPTDEILAQTLTDAGGSFRFDPVIPCGPLSFLRVQASAPGYEPAFQNVSCSRAEQVANLELTPTVTP